VRLILHVGTHKTGTSSIQACMEANRARLRAAGVHYPRCCSVFGGNHSPLCDAMVPDPNDDRWRAVPGWDAFVAECREAGAPAVLVSGEIFGLRLADRARAHTVRRMFDTLFDEITVVVYLRRQDDFLRSMYVEALKHGFYRRAHLGRDFEETAANIAGAHADYLRLIRVLDEAFGREHLRIRVFEKGQLHPAGLIADFLETCGIPPAGLDRAAPAEVNVSPGRKVVTAMGLARAVFEGLHGKESPRHYRESVMGGTHGILTEAWPGDAKFVGFPPGKARELVERFRESNAGIAREYLGRPDGVLFRDERYVELAPGERDEVPLTKADVRFILDAIDLAEELVGRPGPAGLRMLTVAPQVFFDTGRGFAEEGSILSRRYVPAGGTLTLSVPCAGELSAVRLDPAFEPCVLAVREARAVRADGGSAALRLRETNALRGDDGRLYFDTADPWIVYDAPGPCARLEFSLVYEDAGASAAARCIPLLKRARPR
jgi:hypothetical protein